jgi:hypothetical protein
MRKIDREINLENYYLSWGMLRNVIEKLGLPDNTPILYQRIEDEYFDKFHWEPNLILNDTDKELDDSETGHYIRSWGFLVVEDKNGKKAILIHELFTRMGKW